MLASSLMCVASLMEEVLTSAKLPLYDFDFSSSRLFFPIRIKIIFRHTHSTVDVWVHQPKSYHFSSLNILPAFHFFWVRNHASQICLLIHIFPKTIFRSSSPRNYCLSTWIQFGSPPQNRLIELWILLPLQSDVWLTKKKIHSLLFFNSISIRLVLIRRMSSPLFWCVAFVCFGLCWIMCRDPLSFYYFASKLIMSHLESVVIWL